MAEAEAPRIAAVILAAGTASRFRAEDAGAPTKLVALYKGRPLVRHVAEAALASRARPVLVVTGHAREAVETALAGLDLQRAHNPDFASGLASSLRTGVAALPGSCDGAVILLGDMPLVGAGLINSLIDAFAGRREARAVAPLHGGARGNPALVARRMFGEIAQLTGDQGARRLFAGGGVIDVPIDDAAVTLDIDTPAALKGLQSS
jgi:molybdenum cofactor cytidylyltransferase